MCDFEPPYYFFLCLIVNTPLTVAEILGALVSTWIIWVLSSVFFYIAIHRLISTDFTINADYMLITASIGVIINIV